MLAASAKFRPAVAWFARQIAPSVLATLIAALVISGYNRAFSGHLQQPRMAALHAAENAVLPAALADAHGSSDAVATPKPAYAAAHDIAAIFDAADEPVRIADKDDGRESGKDGRLKIADAAPTAVAPAPAPRSLVTRPEIRQEPRIERAEPRAVEPRGVVTAPAQVMPGQVMPAQVMPAPVASAPVAPAQGGYLAIQQPARPAPAMQQPVVVSPAPVMAPQQMQANQMPVSHEPPPVITGAAKPMVTVPDRPGLRPPYEAQQPMPAQEAAAQPEQDRGVFGSVVNALKPSTIFRGARALGDKIEQAGNDILPNIRQQ